MIYKRLLLLWKQASKVYQSSSTLSIYLQGTWLQRI